MRVLIANPGSTSYKCKLYETEGMDCLFQASVQRIGHAEGGFDYRFGDGETLSATRPFPDHRTAIESALEAMQQTIALDSIAAVGFKVVVAKDVTGCVELTEDVLHAMREYMALAPVHTQAYLTAISILGDLMPNTPMIGLFETAFHSEISQDKYLYGIPYEYYLKHGIRKYGFHGASHKYISYRVVQAFNNGDPDCRIISCHLGGSSSVCAIKNGVSIDSSMGMSPQSGLINAQRTGDLDPFALMYLMEKENLSIQQTRDLLANQSGLLGISGISGDLRDIQAAMEDGNPRAKAAFETFVNYTRRYIGEYLVALNGTDYLVFTAGSGQHSAVLRKAIVREMDGLGIVLDDAKNSTNFAEALISSNDSAVRIAVIPTNEELIVVQAIRDKLG